MKVRPVFLESSQQKPNSNQDILQNIKQKIFNKEEILKHELEVVFFKKVRDIIFCWIARFFLIVECAFCTYMITMLTSNNKMILLIIPAIFILLDGVYLSFFRDGKEYTW